MYLVPKNNFEDIYGYVKTSDIQFRSLEYFDSLGAICELKSEFNEDGSLNGFEVTGVPQYC